MLALITGDGDFPSDRDGSLALVLSDLLTEENLGLHAKK